MESVEFSSLKADFVLGEQLAKAEGSKRKFSLHKDAVAGAYLVSASRDKMIKVGSCWRSGNNAAHCGSQTGHVHFTFLCLCVCCVVVAQVWRIATEDCLFTLVSTLLGWDPLFCPAVPLVCVVTATAIGLWCGVVKHRSVPFSTVWSVGFCCWLAEWARQLGPIGRVPSFWEIRDQLF